MSAGFVVEPLSSAHRRAGFRSDVAALDRYLAEYATQDIKRRLSNCFVLLDDEGTIAGYYTFAATSIPLSDLPPAETKGLPRYAVLPAGLIGRLAVDHRFRGRGFGGVLIIDAIRRSGRADPAIFSLVVDAKDDSAISFYEHLGFKRFVSRPMSLFLPITPALRALSGG